MPYGLVHAQRQRGQVDLLEVCACWPSRTERLPPALTDDTSAGLVGSTVPSPHWSWKRGA